MKDAKQLTKQERAEMLEFFDVDDAGVTFPAELVEGSIRRLLSDLEAVGRERDAAVVLLTKYFPHVNWPRELRDVANRPVAGVR